MPKDGFNLLETALVILLLGTICCLSVSFVTVTDHTIIRHELDRLAAVLYYMQRKAVLDHKMYDITFLPTGNQYRAETTHTFACGVCIGLVQGTVGPPSKPTLPLMSALTWPDNKIALYPDGTISAGAVYLTNVKKTCLYALTCDASDGTHIRRYRYDGHLQGARWTLLD